jgi:hypothetical protein
MGVWGHSPQPGVPPLHPVPICRVCYLNWYNYNIFQGTEGQNTEPFLRLRQIKCSIHSFIKKLARSSFIPREEDDAFRSAKPSHL